MAKKMGAVYVESVPEDMSDIAVALGHFHMIKVVFDS